MTSPGIAYLLWVLGLFGFCGIHRFYLGKPLTGLLWFFTVGLFFVGQFIDLLLIPGMVEKANRRFVGYRPPRW
jgi:TM2 domain-containing membrane protein YozV